MTAERIDKRYENKMQHSLTAEYYDHSGFYNFGYWTDDTASQLAACENLLEKLLAFIPRRNGRILDIACGFGATTRYLLNHYEPADVCAVNISPQQLAFAKARVPEVDFLCMDAAHLGFAAESFDNAVCVEAAFHFDTRERFLHQVRRLLKPNGRLVMSDILFPRWSTRLNARVPNENWVVDLDAYRDVFKDAGFKTEAVIDATAETWKGFYRHSRQWRRDKLRQRRIGRLSYAGMIMRTFLADKGLEQYLLVAAQKV